MSQSYTPAQFYCEKCEYTCNTKQKYTRHLETRKHNTDLIFYCDKCKYTCYTRQKYTRHLKTKKHITTKSLFYCNVCEYTGTTKQRYEAHLITQKHVNNIKLADNYKCSKCDKQYKYLSGLNKHIKNGCSNQNNSDLIANNVELVNTIVKLSKTMQKPTVIHNNTNSFNKTFNLNIFLNETCKDAINMGEFIDSIHVSLKDLENIGDKGYVKGISNIIIKNLENLDEAKRPVHCSDIKRETLYVKDNNTWEKEEYGYPKMINAVNHISSKSIGQLKPWREANPGFNDPSSRNSDTYQTLVRESCESGDAVDTKIVKRVAKAVPITGK